MADAAPLTLVRAPAWQVLTRRLAAAVAHDARLLAARDSILRPIELLRIMAADAPAALADDVLRADRLRSLLFLVWPYATIASEARALLSTNVHPAAGLKWPEPQPYEPGVIDHAALLVLMLAAARVADRPFAPVFVATVHGLALAASAAEVLGRLDPRQPDAAALEIVLETMYVVEDARKVTRSEALHPLALDPVERGRWHCLDHLLATGPLARQAIAMDTWDGATSHEILRVHPRTIAAGDVLVVTARRLPGDPDPLRDAQVIFASADGEPLVAEASLRPPATPSAGDTIDLEVLVPDGAETGWIGFSRPDLIVRSNQVRDELRRALAVQLTDACVEGIDRIDPVRAIPHYGVIAVPRRRGLNRVEHGLPIVTFASIAPAHVTPGAPFDLAWQTTGADAVTIESGGHPVIERGEPSGHLVLTAGSDDGEAAYVITPRRDRAGAAAAGKPHSVALTIGSPVAITAVEVTQGGRAAPLLAERALDIVARLDAPRARIDGQLFLDDHAAASIASGARRPGAIAFTIPADAVRDRMSITIVVTDATGARVNFRHGPIELGRVGQAQVVLARPVVLDRDERRIDFEEATSVLGRAAGELGLELDIIDLPWLDDELAAIVQLPTTDGDPSLTRVLEALAHRALVTPGFEHALWLVMLPGDADHVRSVARWAPGYAARALAIADPTAIARLLAEVFTGDVPVGATGRYLALNGTIAEGDLQIAASRVDDRRAGPGAPSKTGLEVVTRDGAGRELSRHTARVLSELRPARLDVLIPISDEVAVVELRSPTATLARLARARGNLTIDVEPGDPAVPPALLAWTWHHDRNARPSVSLLLRRGALATPVLAVDPCSSKAELPLWRFRAADGLALYATDGWNTVERVVHGGPIDRELTVVLRRLSDGRLFADVPRDAAVTWRLDGEPRGDGARMLSLQSGDTGELVLEARRGGVVARDHRAVIAGELT